MESVSEKALFVDSLNYLINHPVFSSIELLSLGDGRCEPLRISHFLATLRIVSEQTEGYPGRVSLRTGPYSPGRGARDADLDSSGDTFEEAIMEMSVKVNAKYGDDGSRVTFTVPRKTIVTDRHGEELAPCPVCALLICKSTSLKLCEHCHSWLRWVST